MRVCLQIGRDGWLRGKKVRGSGGLYNKSGKRGGTETNPFDRTRETELGFSHVGPNFGTF